MVEETVEIVLPLQRQLEQLIPVVVVVEVGVVLLVLPVDQEL